MKNDLEKSTCQAPGRAFITFQSIPARDTFVYLVNNYTKFNHFEAEEIKKTIEEVSKFKKIPKSDQDTMSSEKAVPRLRVRASVPDVPVNINWEVFFPKRSPSKFKKLVIWITSLLLLVMRKLSSKN